MADNLENIRQIISCNETNITSFDEINIHVNYTRRFKMAFAEFCGEFLVLIKIIVDLNICPKILRFCFKMKISNDTPVIHC